MGFFKKIFGQSDKPTTPEQMPPQQELAAYRSEQELLERFGGFAFDKQMDFSEAIGNNSWNVDMTRGEISFGSNLVFPMQVLGTISHSSQTWLWSWANTQSGLSPAVTKQAMQLKNYGEANGIDLLRNSEFEATTDDLHLIGLIASGMFDSSGYYIADYGQGAMLVTIKSDKVDKIRKDNHHRILTVFPQLISQFDMNHNTALTNYVADKGYTVSENGDKLVAVKNGNTITATFDEQARLTKLNG